MKTFVTGGTGYIGSEFIRKLIRTDQEVVALYHSRQPELYAENIKWVKGSLDDVVGLSKAMTGCSRVFHMGGLARLSHPEKDAFFRINVKGTENMLTAAKNAGAGKFVFTSTASVLSYSVSTPLSEADPLLEPLDDDYSVTKYIAETMVLNESKNGLHTVVVNPPRVYGPGKAAVSSPINKMVADYLYKPFYFIPGDGRYAGNFAFIDDVINGHLLAMEKGRSGERYILGGENHDFIEFYETLSKLTKYKRRRICVPRWVLDSAASLADFWHAVSGNAPKVTPAIVSKIFSNRLLTCKKAIQELGYQVTPFATGLQLTLSYIQQHHHAKQ